MPDNSIASKILKSSLWQYLGSWLDKLIGFISTIILARILVPDDFGIVAAASVVTGFFSCHWYIRNRTISDQKKRNFGL